MFIYRVHAYDNDRDIDFIQDFYSLIEANVNIAEWRRKGYTVSMETLVREINESSN